MAGTLSVGTLTEAHIIDCEQKKSLSGLNAKQPDTAMVKVIQQMHAHKDKAEVHSVLSVARLHGDIMKDNGALTQCFK